MLDEWQRVIVREGQRSPESAESVAAAVRTHFGRYRIDPESYRDKIADDLSSDSDDRVHAAACIHGDVDVLLTRDMKHLRTKPILAAGVKILTSDIFLCDLLTAKRSGVVDSFRRAANAKKNPPMTPEDLADKVGNAGAPDFAQRLRAHLQRQRW